jgi:hypothetical protein
MKVDLRIGHLAIEAPRGRRLDRAELKNAIERELGALIDADSSRGGASLPVKTHTSGRARPPGPGTSARLAHDVAARIHEAIKR